MKNKMPYETAIQVANKLASRLAPLCDRIEIAGSLRRGKPEVGDIELVAIPRQYEDLFGTATRSALPLITLLEANGIQVVKSGNRYIQAVIGGKVGLDLFLTTPEEWGCIFLIRTGSAEFAHRVVTPKRYGGLCPSHLRFKDGRLMNGSQALPTPEETDVFNVLGLAYIQPEAREK